MQEIADYLNINRSTVMRILRDDRRSPAV